MNDQIVNEFNDEAREVEARIEELGKMICSIPNSGPTWQHVNRALDEIQRAIYSSSEMYSE